MASRYYYNKTVANKYVANRIVVKQESLVDIMEKLSQAHGNWVIGKRFWDRETELAMFLNRIEAGSHVLLVAQRRMGKTSLMKEAARRMETSYTCVFVDLQKAMDPKEAISELGTALRPHTPLWSKTKELFVNIIDRFEKIEIDDIGVTLRAGLTSGNWADKGDKLFGILAASDKPVVLLLDEVPIFINRLLKGDSNSVTATGRKTADEFMSWLRKNSIEHQGTVRIVISGSIGLEPVLRQAGLSSTINNYPSLDLLAWDESTAIGCLRALATGQGVVFHDDAEQEMVKLLGCSIPHHVQMFFDHVNHYCVRKGSPDFYVTEVEDVYRKGMLSVNGHVEMSHYEERLRLVLGSDKLALAIEMLSEAAVTGYLTKEAIKKYQDEYKFEAETTSEVQEYILWVLEHDGYFARKDKGYAFVSNLLRDWWKRGHEMFFTPILDRTDLP